MIFEHLFKRIWLIIDLILYILAAGFIVFGLFLWSKIAGFLAIGVFLAILGRLTEVLAVREGE